MVEVGWRACSQTHHHNNNTHQSTRTTMSSRKRRRSQAFQQEDIELEAQAPVEELEGGEKGQEEKEREVWDLVREERYESACSLRPLTPYIHRLQSLSSCH